MNRRRHPSINLLINPLLLVCIALLWLSGLAQAATLTASVDRTRVASDETLNLSLKIDTRAATGQPDLSLLQPYFEILSSRKSTQMRIINGDAESWTEWSIALAPKVVGRILLPPFEFDGARSAPLQIEVTASKAPGGTPNDDYYLELETDTASAYVDQQIKLSIRLYTAVNLSSLEAQPLQLEDADVIKLDEQQYQKVQQGRRFLVYELNYAIFPRTPGTLEIPPQRFNAVKDAPRSLFDSRLGQQLRLSSQTRSLEVLAPPSQINSRDWLPAASLSLSQTLSQPDGNYRVGEPITRTLTLQAEGVEAKRLPQLPPLSSLDFKQYPEPAQLDQQTPASGIHASRTERYGLVPTRPGPLELPALELHWWDTAANQPRVARVPAQTLNVLPPRNAPGVQSNPPTQIAAPQQPRIPAPVQPAETGSSAWLYWSNLIWAAISLLFAGLWWRARKGAVQAAALPPSPPLANTDEAQAFRALEAACRQGDWGSIRQALSRWRGLASGATTHTGAFEDEALDQQIARLDGCLYGKEALESFDAQALLDAARGYRQRLAESGTKTEGLPPLYR